MPTTFNTTDPKPGYVYDAALDTWFPLVGIAPASQVDRWTKTAAGGETSLSGNDDSAVSLSYTSGTEQVYLNGVLLARGSDYTATNGTTITGLTALAASDIAEVITFNPSNILTTNAVIASDFSAKGDLISASAASTPVRLPVGTTGQVLKANSATTSGLEWGADNSYSAPTLGSTSITSGATVSNVDGLTVNSTTIPTSKTLVATDSTVSDATTATAARGIGYMGVPQSTAATTGAYTVTAADAGEHIYSTATRTITIDSNANLALPVGTAITFIAASGTTVTIAITSDTLLLAGAGTTGSRTLAPFGMATAVKITSTSWIISGNGLS
jgi:hypothetical protein